MLEPALVGHIPPKVYTVRCVLLGSATTEKENAEAKKLAFRSATFDTVGDRVIDISIHVPPSAPSLIEVFTGLKIQNEEFEAQEPA